MDDRLLDCQNAFLQLAIKTNYKTCRAILLAYFELRSVSAMIIATLTFNIKVDVKKRILQYYVVRNIHFIEFCCYILIIV
jgi:hypothetical protein